MHCYLPKQKEDLINYMVNLNVEVIEVPYNMICLRSIVKDKTCVLIKKWLELRYYPKVITKRVRDRHVHSAPSPNSVTRLFKTRVGNLKIGFEIFRAFCEEDKAYQSKGKEWDTYIMRKSMVKGVVIFLSLSSKTSRT